MSLLTLSFSGLWHHRRAYLGVLLGITLCSMVLTGSLLVGDSLKGTLREQASNRLGRAQSAVSGAERFFRSALADLLHTRSSEPTAAVLLAQGSAARSDSAARINRVQVLGVEDAFWKMSTHGAVPALKAGEVAVNETLAARLGIRVGDALVVRMEKPSAFSKDAPLSGEEESIAVLRAEVGAVVGDTAYGRFALQASQIPPASVFFPLETLQRRLDLEGRCNLLLSAAANTAVLARALEAEWSLEDAALSIRPLGERDAQTRWEVRSSRVFLENPLVDSLLPLNSRGNPSLTYFVNGLFHGEKSTPYSMVSAVEPGSEPFVPADLAPDEMVVHSWLAEDLGLTPGDRVEIRYYVMGAKRNLEEKSASFRIRAVEPVAEKGWDKSWMPDFPGLADVGNCRDWKPGFAIDGRRIRDKDEAYWKQHRGTPKAFIGLEAARQIWANRWGTATAMRYASGTEEKLRESIGTVLRPEKSGIQILPLLALSQAAADMPVDFGGLFAGFSFFLMAAALALVGLLFALLIEQRRGEIGTLLALGWRPARVRSLFWAEGAGVAVLGVLLGAGAGVAYTDSVLRALNGIWSGATGGVQVNFYASAASLATGMVSACAAAFAAIGWAARGVWKRPVPELLAGGITAGKPFGQTGPGRPGQFGRWATAAAWALAAAGVVFLLRSGQTAPEWFFLCGSLALAAFLGAVRWFLLAAASGEMDSLGLLALRNAGRRVSRSLTTVAVLAAGGFLVLSVQVFRKEPDNRAAERSSGTGGFALVGELASPVYEDLNAEGPRDTLGLSWQNGMRCVAVRVREGEDASCLNLNRAVQPRILGVPSTELESLGAFRFLSEPRGWGILRHPPTGEPPAIPAVVDEATLQWALQKKKGDVMVVPDGRGGSVRLQIVAALAGSILQGSLIIDESEFVRIFPDAGGYRMLLLDVPPGQIAPVRAGWSRALEDRGLELAAASERLAELDAVSNTYLSIFQILGGLGVLLGSLGGAVVAARNTLERSGEWAILNATGWPLRRIRRLLHGEHLGLVLAGLLGGGLSALWVTLPSQWVRGESVAVGQLFKALAFLGGISACAVWIALRWSLARRPAQALRAE